MDARLIGKKVHVGGPIIPACCPLGGTADSAEAFLAAAQIAGGWNELDRGSADGRPHEKG